MGDWRLPGHEPGPPALIPSASNCILPSDISKGERAEMWGTHFVFELRIVTPRSDS